jgi:hypothetical protein
MTSLLAMIGDEVGWNFVAFPEKLFRELSPRPLSKFKMQAKLVWF